MWQQEVGKDLQAGVRVHVSVELDQGLGLVVGQPDGGDALELDEGDGQVRDVVTSQVEDSQLRQVTHFIRQPETGD